MELKLCVVTNTVRFLLQLVLRPGYVEYHRHIFTEDISESINCNTHHAELIAKPVQSFNSMCHGNKFGSKDIFINSVLILGEPVN